MRLSFRHPLLVLYTRYQLQCRYTKNKDKTKLLLHQSYSSFSVCLYRTAWGGGGGEALPDFLILLFFLVQQTNHRVKYSGSVFFRVGNKYAEFFFKQDSQHCGPQQRQYRGKVMHSINTISRIVLKQDSQEPQSNDFYRTATTKVK